MASWEGRRSGSGEGAHRADECHGHSRQTTEQRCGGLTWREWEWDGNISHGSCRVEEREEGEERRGRKGGKGTRGMKKGRREKGEWEEEEEEGNEEGEEGERAATWKFRRR